MLPPFGLDPARQVDVGGRPAGPPPEWLGARHRLVLGLFALGLLCVGGLAGLSIAAFASGARGLAAAFGLAAVLASPPTLLGPVQDWWRHRRA
ncbi:MAG: hypothetical protein H7345_05505 [Rubritepida sp.]|nr:hypothetical protein [Rubritepida sp.]